MKIIVEDFGIIHYVASCANCDFQAGIQTPECRTRADVLRAVRKHVKTTGHVVSIESGRSTRYSITGEF